MTVMTPDEKILHETIIPETIQNFAQYNNVYYMEIVNFLQKQAKKHGVSIWNYAQFIDNFIQPRLPGLKLNRKDQYKPPKNKKVHILDYAKNIGATLTIKGEISENNPYLIVNLVKDNRSVEVIEGSFLKSAYGRSAKLNLQEAIQDLVNNISNQDITFTGSSLYSLYVPTLTARKPKIKEK